MRAEPLEAPVTTESSAPDEVMARVRKLFALAGSPNEQEARAGARAVLRHNLGAESGG